MRIIIIGGGILGASAAYHLAKDGIEVIIIDKADPGQATNAAAGIICPWLSQRRNKTWYTLARNGARFYPKLIQALADVGETNTGYRQVGSLSIHNDIDKLIKLKERALKRRIDAEEIGNIEILNEQETKEHFPLLAPGYSAVFVEGAARIDGQLFRDALLRTAEKYGATRINGDAVLLYKDNKVIGAKVNGKSIEADQVIVTAGAWLDQLLKPLQVKPFVSAQKAQIIHLSLDNTQTVDWPVIMPPNDQYILPFADGNIVIGATHENEHQFDQKITAGGVYEILTKALAIAPGLADAALKTVKVGFRPFTPGFLPVFGKLPHYEGIIIANGLGASGLTMGPYLGSILANIALNKAVAIDLEPYSIKNMLETLK